MSLKSVWGKVKDWFKKAWLYVVMSLLTVSALFVAPMLMTGVGTDWTANNALYLPMNLHLLDYSSYKNNATNYGADNSSGFIGNGTNYIRSSTDWVQLADLSSDPYDNMNEITIMMWINPVNVTSAGGAGARLIHMNGVWSMFYAYDNRELRVRVYNSTGSSSEVSVNNASALIDYDTWTLVGFTRAADGVITIYQDGVATRTGTVPVGAIRDLSVPVYIGIDEDGTSYAYEGLIDEVSIWRYAMTPSQVAEYYDWQSAGNPVYGEGCTIPYANSAGWYTPVGNETWCTGTYELRLNVSSAADYGSINLNGSTIDCAGYPTCIAWYLNTGHDNVTLDCQGGTIQNWSYTGITIGGTSANTANYNVVTACELTSLRANTSGGASILNDGDYSKFYDLNIHDVNNHTYITGNHLPNHGIYSIGAANNRDSDAVEIYNVNISNVAANGIAFNDGVNAGIDYPYVHDVIINNTGLAGDGSGFKADGVRYGRFENIFVNNTASYCGTAGAGDATTASQYNNFTNITCDNNDVATWNFWNVSNLYFYENNYVDDVEIIGRNLPIVNVKFNESTTKNFELRYVNHPLAGDANIYFTYNTTKLFNYTNNSFTTTLVSPNDDIQNYSSGNIVYDQTDYSFVSEYDGVYYISDFGTGTCTYSGSGDWIIPATDNCTITTNTDVLGNLLITSCTDDSVVTLAADIKVSGLLYKMSGACVLYKPSNSTLTIG